ncbi:MAG TPA: AAA family ATPase [Actinomycetota bacterium]|nr:AAA family ATPase [Actinomycetota bacterium]
MAELVAVDDGAAQASGPIVGRRAELRLLDDALGSVLAQRRCRVVNVVGEAGVGKSRIVEDFESRHTDLTTLRGRCAPTGEASPMRPLAEIVTRAVGTAPDDPPAAIRAALADAGTTPDDIGRLVASIGLGGAPLAGADRAATLRAFIAGVARRSSAGVALVVEDVHHATPEMLDVLRHVAEHTRDAPLLIVCAGRPEILLQHPTWARAPGAITVSLEPLGADEGAELVAWLLPSSEDALRRRIVEIADGNPFFIEEVIAALGAATDARTATDVPANAPAVTDLPVPPTVMSLLDARVDALADDERAVLERAAVLGTTFRSDEVARLYGRDVADVLARLADRDLVVRDPGGGDPSWRFRQALIRDAAYQAVPKQVRVDLHVAVADGSDDDARAGSHLDRATATLRELGSRSSAVDELAERAGVRLTSAGRAASSRGDVSSAATLLARAAELLPSRHPARAEALADLHSARLYAGDIDGAERAVDELFEAARAPDDLVTVRATMQRAHLSFLRDPSALPPAGYREQLEAAIPRFEAEGAESDLATAFTDLALVSWVEGRGAAMVEAAERAIAAAERCGDPRAMHEAAPLLATGLLLGPTPLDEVLRRLRALGSVVPGDRLALATLRLTEAQAFALVGRIDEARAALAAARSTFEDLGQRRWLAASAETDAVIRLEDGDLDGAIADRRSVHAFFAEQGDALNTGVAAATLADVLVRADDISGAESLVAGLEHQASTSDPEVAVTSTAVRAAIASARDDAAAAERLAAEALRIADATDLLLLQADARVTLASGGVDPPGLLRDAVDRYEAKGAVGRAARVRASSA